LEDRAEGAIWKLGNKDEIIKEFAQKKAADEERAALKKKAAEEKLEKERQILEKSKISAPELFYQQRDKYSEFDETGFPVKDAEGKELSKAAVKKNRKEYDAQVKLHQKYIDSLHSK